MSTNPKVSVSDPNGYVWTPGDWRRSAIFEAGIARNEDGSTSEVPKVAEAFAAKGWELVPYDENAPRNREDAKRRGIDLVQRRPQATARRGSTRSRKEDE